MVTASSYSLQKCPADTGFPQASDSGDAIEALSNSLISQSKARQQTHLDQVRRSLDRIKKNINEQLTGQALGKGLQADQQLYPFCGTDAQSVPEGTKRALNALYTRAGNQEIESLRANPNLPKEHNRLALIVHQMNPEMQTATADFLSARLKGVPAIALISTVFRVTSKPFLEYFLERDYESGFVYSNGGNLDYRKSNGVNICRPIQFDFKRLDLAGGFVGLCMRNASTDAITIAIENAERRGQLADLHVNIITALSFNSFPEAGKLIPLSDWLSTENSRMTKNMSLSVAKQLIPESLGKTLPTDWKSGPPYIFKSQTGHRVIVTFDAP